MEPRRDFLIMELALLGFGFGMMLVQDGRNGQLKGEPWKIAWMAQKPFGGQHYYNGETQVWPIELKKIRERIQAWRG